MAQCEKIIAHGYSRYYYSTYYQQLEHDWSFSSNCNKIISSRNCQLLLIQVAYRRGPLISPFLHFNSPRLVSFFQSLNHLHHFQSVRKHTHEARVEQ
jgi:hypothetical protein